jgi:hypothetical protein
VTDKPLRYVALFDAEPTLARALAQRYPSTLPRLRGMSPKAAARWVADVGTPLHEVRLVRNELRELGDGWDCAACDVAVLVVREPLFVRQWRAKLTILRAAGVAVALIIVVHDEDDGDDATERAMRRMLVDLGAAGDDVAVFHVDQARLAHPDVVERIAAHVDDALRAVVPPPRAPGVELVAAQLSVRTWRGIGRLRDLSPSDLQRRVVARLPCVHDPVPVAVDWRWLDAARPIEGRIQITAPPDLATPAVATRRLALSPAARAGAGLPTRVRVTLRPAAGLGAPSRAFEGARSTTSVTLSPGGLSIGRPVWLRGDMILLDVASAQVGDVVAFCTSTSPTPVVAGLVDAVEPAGIDVHRAPPPGFLQGGRDDDLAVEPRAARPVVDD